jgi:DNA modification methylase
METRHRVVVGDARDMSHLDDDAVEQVVTSPPYPMIEMWDDLFSDLDEAVGEHLRAGEGSAAFERMHRLLDEVWREVARVLVPGGIACVNVGDATRKVDGSFRVYPNHARVVEAFEDLGFEPLPDVLWRKPTNSGTKFMGSGMVPPNAYVTLEHEYVLVFRNGCESRTFEPGATDRYESAYFWEERNRWFSDVWTDVTGTRQRLTEEAGERGDGGGAASVDPEVGVDEARERTAAYPFEIPYRLVNMYSVYGDTVLDPFMGTGTTSLAALVAGRDSVGYELDDHFASALGARVAEAPALSERVVETRLADHREFVRRRHEDGDPPSYEADHYDFPVVTKQEQSIRFYAVTDVEPTESGYRAAHDPV